MIMAVKPLDETVREMARAAALEDSRFAPVTEDELDKLQVEISVLSPMFAIAPEDVVVGRHGLMISYGGRRGLLLPQVALEWGWDRETFLAQLCRKAGLPLDQWKHGAQIEAFTAEVFGEKEPGESLRE
jgi:AmmeMemoRadiSam system protein A